MEAVGGRLDDLTGRPPSWAEGLAQHIEMVRDHVDTVGEKVTPIGELPSLWADVGTVGESVDESLDPPDRRRRPPHPAAGDAWRRPRPASPASTRPSPTSPSALDRLEADVTESLTTGLDNVVTRLTATLDQIATRISGVEGQQSASNARLSAISEAQSGAKAQTHALEGQVAGVTARLDRIDSRIETADECLADIDTRVTGIEAKLTENGDKLDVTDRAVTTLDERLGVCVGDAETRLASKVEALEEQLGERFDGVDDRRRVHQPAPGPAARDAGDRRTPPPGRRDRPPGRDPPRPGGRPRGPVDHGGARSHRPDQETGRPGGNHAGAR